ncbi:hypothetical protein OG609_18125 [Streptomyces sp. NBC_01224]|uniref:hypothetical protein n=1 Tax=Streptomyces sp. NBC_01224 TaxID=2903783 RepID=UPI002E0D4185|nr:hypothetical protein OG609_18125 [Streptomyces sp. NBC_01224]
MAADVSGGAFVVVSMSLAEDSLPSETLPSTSSLILSALPDLENLSASSRFFGACASIALFTASMNACLLNSPGFAAFIFSAFAALPCASLSSGGAMAASCADFDSAAAGAWTAILVRFAVTSALTLRKPGAWAGEGFTGAV